MPELTKQDIKEVFVETLEPFAKGIQEDFKKVDERFNKIDKRLDKDFGEVKINLANINTRLSSVETDVKWMKDNSSELFSKIDGFTALYTKQEEQMTVFVKQMGRFEERLSKLETKSPC